MFCTFVMAVALAAKPPEPVKLKLVVPTFTGPENAERLGSYTAHFARRLREHLGKTFEILATRPGRQADLEKCKEQETCVSGLAKTWGVDGVVIGNVGKIDRDYQQINLKIVGPGGLFPSTWTRRARPDKKEMEDALDLVASKMASAVVGALGESPSKECKDWKLRPCWPFPALSAVGLTVAGSWFSWQAHDKFNQVPVQHVAGAQPVSYEEMRAVVESGKRDQLLAQIAFVGAGVAAVVTVWFYQTGDPAPRAPFFHLAPMPSGVALVWSWP